MLYIRTLFPDVSFDLVKCNADCPDLYDAGTIDGAFVWGGVMEKLKERVLGISSGPTEYDRTSLCYDSVPILTNLFPVAFHFQLLEI